MIRLALRVQRERAELVLAELLELVAGGVEEVDDGGGTVEYALYGSPGELPELPALHAAAAGALVQVSTTEIPDDWDERWKDFHRPVLIHAPGAAHRRRAEAAGCGSVGAAGRGSAVADHGEAGSAGSAAARDGAAAGDGVTPSSLRVRTPWQPAGDMPGVPEIVIEPARAFGTGAHHTTRTTLGLLLQLAVTSAARGAALDIGTGSGVLAIAAAKLGFAPVLALDSERESVEAASENASANGVEIQVRRQDIRSQPPTCEGFHVVLANLVRPLLLELAQGMHGAPDHLIVSGLLREEADEAVAAFAEHHRLAEQRRIESGEWAAVWLSAPPR